MSSRSEVLIRILALLQRKTLIETKNRTLKFLKWHCLTERSMKNVAVLTVDGAFALFFRPHPGGFDSSKVPIPRNFPSKARKMPLPGGQRVGWGASGGLARVELTDALQYVWVYMLSVIGSWCCIGSEYRSWSRDIFSTSCRGNKINKGKRYLHLLF